MKVLILGSEGMGGHVMKEYFMENPKYKVYYTSRNQDDQDSIYLDVTDSRSVEKVINDLRPDIAINCIGILNDAAEKQPMLAFQVNSLFPHQLVKLMERHQGKVIHISTDCVFLGTKGNYTEKDIPDGISTYARSKRWGEIISSKHTTIRTSIIGPELKENGIGIFLWFMKQTGEIKGYEKVLWNGVTTLELAKAAEQVIEQNIIGLYHLGSKQKISKYFLLTLMKEIFEKDDVMIIPDGTIVLDRTIKNTRPDFSYQVPGYRELLTELKGWMEKH
ncbi:dTDP-4-dehydrorhamnose reductase family protein [Bacillus cereus]|uniref:dTDP-4-dehydrorhamnose reductase n=1 Tax=Bacillus cereus TaxID=1396 RepID=A0AAW5L7D6_BACCE|nr:SDR family oxidoreductase [Bacillus cereus]MCQ6288439.1 SDR family oxidoreductase [Bacillus cereus]MCQ6317585.1 SDR family oxidoreductase [Bacillus cereus]MCQ6328559.1 SDR family oxidoreductase [Bacillus cereus]MCQ6385554.1 SDR family oxidoreductase [Bacillus cereus]